MNDLNETGTTTTTQKLTGRFSNIITTRNGSTDNYRRNLYERETHPPKNPPKAGPNIHRSRYPGLPPLVSNRHTPERHPLSPLPALLIFERTAELCLFGNKKSARFSGGPAPEHLEEDSFPSQNCRSSVSHAHIKWLYRQSRARRRLESCAFVRSSLGLVPFFVQNPFVQNPWSPCFCCLFRRSIGYHLSVSLTRSARQAGQTPHTIITVERRAHYLKFGFLLNSATRWCRSSPLPGKYFLVFRHSVSQC